jgi:transposase-like protein
MRLTGSKADAVTREKAYALFATEDNVSRIARELGVPDSTVRGWKKKYDEECAKDPVKAKARDDQKSAFVQDCWGIINNSIKVAARRIERAANEEERIDALIDAVCDASAEADLDPKRESDILRKVESLKCEDLVKLTTVIGTLYDKQALASGDNTANVGVTPFEGL